MGHILTVYDEDGNEIPIPAIQGRDGATPNLQIGTVKTLGAGSEATASITGTAENPLLNLGIPRGEDGSDGGGSVELKLVKRIETTEDVTSFAITEDENGNSFELSEIAFVVKGISLGNQANWGIKINNVLFTYGTRYISNSAVTISQWHGTAFCMGESWMFEVRQDANAATDAVAVCGVKESVGEKCTSFWIGATNSDEAGYKAGTILELWGR